MCEDFHISHLSHVLLLLLSIKVTVVILVHLRSLYPGPPINLRNTSSDVTFDQHGCVHGNGSF